LLLRALLSLTFVEEVEGVQSMDLHHAVSSAHKKHLHFKQGHRTVSSLDTTHISTKSSNTRRKMKLFAAFSTLLAPVASAADPNPAASAAASIEQV